jgi:hypothetical protein
MGYIKEMIKDSNNYDEGGDLNIIGNMVYNEVFHNI